MAGFWLARFRPFSGSTLMSTSRTHQSKMVLHCSSDTESHVSARLRVSSIAAAMRSEPIRDLIEDHGERDLFAHAIGRSTPPLWCLCSPDKASIRAAVALGSGARGKGGTHAAWGSRAGRSTAPSSSGRRIPGA